MYYFVITRLPTCTYIIDCGAGAIIRNYELLRFIVKMIAT